MYGFLDTNEASEQVRLPSEALRLNGSYIENLIPGYRTLHVSGREALSPDVESVSTGIRSGSRLKSRRYPERIITVTYQLLAGSNGAFREAYNRLGQILDVEDAQLVFRDEPDKYFTGTPCIIGDVKPGTNSVVGEIEFLCTDPFKYSLAEYEAKPEAGADSVLIDYGGTYRGYPRLTVAFPGGADNEDEAAQDLADGDCGYVSFFSEDGKLIQLGDPVEVDSETTFEKSQTLVNSKFRTSASWGETAQAQWVKNEYGEMGMCAVSGSDYYLAPTAFGTGEQWHGPCITRTLPADRNGESGAKNVTLTYSHKFAIGPESDAVRQLGTFQVVLYSGVWPDGKIVAALNVHKHKVGRNAKLRFYINHALVETMEVDATCDNPYFHSGKCTTIQKAGDTVFFNVSGIQKTFRSAEIEGDAVHSVMFTFSQFQELPAVAHNGLYWAKIVKSFCDSWKDVPNKFSGSDEAEADCGSGEILLNGVPSPQLGALENNWEGFYLRPGLNKIGFSWSEWAASAPDVAVRYREVFL